MSAIVVIDDEISLARKIGLALEAVGHQVTLAHTASDGLGTIREAEADLVLLDLRLPDRSGLEVLSEIREIDSRLPVVLITAHGSVSDAVSAMRRGATDYLQKPLDLDELRLLVERILDRQREERELAYHRGRGRTLPAGVVGQDSSLQQVFAQANRLAQAGLEPGKRPPILLTGETGTGKGVIARAVHEILGGRAFLEVNCTALPETLVEAELFGHERGSFTDAKTARPGLFEAAEGGTLFLDEIGHASLGIQAKLLKVLDDRRVRRLGSSRDRAVNVHVIAATNRDLDQAVEAREFREDLLHRLRVLSFEILPLRERVGDIALLARHFCEELGHVYGRSVTLSADGQRELLRYPWPGNVRELRNVIERAILLAQGSELGPAQFASLLRLRREGAEKDPFALPEGGVNLEELEKHLIQQALERCGGNRTRAAALVGLNRHTLRYRLEKYGLE